MSQRIVVHTPDVASPYGPHAHATRSGPFLFVSAQLAVNPATGRPVVGYADLPPGAPRLGMGRMAPDSREGPAIAQTWQLYQQLKAILAAAGSTEQHVLLMMLYMKSAREFPSVIRVREKIFAPEDPPPSTAGQVAAFALPQSVVSMDAIAVVPGGGVDKVVIPRTRQFDQMALSHYQLASRAGDLLFVAGVVGARPERGEIIRTVADLEPDDRRRLAFASVAERDRDEMVAAQTAFIYRALGGILGEHGATLADLVKTTVYLTDVRTLPVVDRIGRTFLGARPPASTVYEVEQLAMPDFLVEIDGVAALPGGASRVETFAGEAELPLHASAMTRAGGLTFLSGLMADGPLGTDDLTALGIDDALDGLAVRETEGQVTRQAAAIYANAARLLAKAGITFDDVLRASVYLRDIRDYAAVERLHRHVFGSAAPALVVCQTGGLPLRGARVQVELVAG